MIPVTPVSKQVSADRGRVQISRDSSNIMSQSWLRESDERTLTHHALVMVASFLAFWLLIWFVLGDGSLRNLGMGVIAAIVFGGVHYAIDSR